MTPPLATPDITMDRDEQVHLARLLLEALRHLPVAEAMDAVRCPTCGDLPPEVRPAD